MITASALEFFWNFWACNILGSPWVIVNFMCHLDWDKGCLESWQTLVLGISVRVFPESTSIWISRLSKEDRPSQCGWTPTNPFGVWIEQEGKRINSLSLIYLWHPSIFSCPHHRSFWQDFRPKLNFILVFLFSSLQMENYRTSQPI